MFSNFDSQMIPSDLVKYCNEDFSTNVILIGPFGDPCQVTIFEKDGIYMQKGWPRFLRNNLIVENELLLFTYEGENYFHVQIFDVNGSERLNTNIAGQLEASRHNIFRCGSTQQKSSATKVYSSFFTVFIPKFCSERLLIPNDILKLASFEERVPKKLILRNYSEVGWNVRALRVGDNICFVDGWKQFVADNCLEGEDFIFFKYDGKDKMKFKVLKLCGWEQIGEKDVGINAIEIEFMQIEKEKDWVFEKQDDESGEHIGGNHHIAGKASAGKRITARSSGSNNIANAKYVHYDNPYFTAIQQKSRENELHFSKKMIDDFSLNLPQKITLLCCEHDGRNDVPEETHIRKNRRTVTGELQKWNDGRTCYKGWRRFCRINNIDMNKDECICEFVMGEDQQIQMLQVHVVKNGLLMSAT
ncbi:putative transcription factor B3-Domain family [Lupinus albus]|uniref:Putative transcription factor B3-Domain family n=1 Tax=Lupinus albus TaxID=3870 RepID=A0A6A4R2W5_LUPAL|nr:putative transcription factor B3-Domain family [Lupinus albus]